MICQFTTITTIFKALPERHRVTYILVQALLVVQDLVDLQCHGLTWPHFVYLAEPAGLAVSMIGSPRGMIRKKGKARK